MRVLVLLRGAMGAGKSTWIEKNNLKPYTVSADDIRLLYQSPILKEDGDNTITMKNDKKVWTTLHSILRDRMINGDFTVVDATHVNEKSINAYRELAREFRYRVVVVDFSDVPIEVAKMRNNERPDYKRVPEEAIDKAYKRMGNGKIPSWVEVVKPDEFGETMFYRPNNYSDYKKIHHIGDVHGCNTALQEYLSEGLKDDELYIFLGDFIDRGVENAEVVKFLFSIMDKKNVILLEGNHERWLWMWANDKKVVSKEFNQYTAKQLEEAGIDKKMTRRLYRKLHQAVLYYYMTDSGVMAKVLVTHGGLGNLPSNLLTVPTEQLIKGVGDYSTDIDDIFDNYVKSLSVDIRGGVGNQVLYSFAKNDNIFQIHGHRNIFGHDIFAKTHSFNLEGGVEKGGHLRVVTLDKSGFDAVEIKNDIFDERNLPKKITEDTSVNDMIKGLRENRYINEKKMPDNISSFNFTRQAFKKGVWDYQTMKSRGLFVNTNTEEIVARSYDKFFNVNEQKETAITSMSENMVFPVTVRQKPNGFLGILGYNNEKDELVFSSKSSTTSVHASWFKEIFLDSVAPEDVMMVKEFLRDEQVTLTFEVIDPINDPHIIKYDERKVILLDIVYRTPVFNKMSYHYTVVLADNLGLEYAKVLHSFHEWESFKTWYDDTMSSHIEEEGYIIEDSNGFMTKLKLPYYNHWKKMRHLKDMVVSGRKPNKIDFESVRFYHFISTIDKEKLAKMSIIELREIYQMIK